MFERSLLTLDCRCQYQLDLLGAMYCPCCCCTHVASSAFFGPSSCAWCFFCCCRYHRILDLRRFRDMVADGTIPPESFTTIRSVEVEAYSSSLKISKQRFSSASTMSWLKVAQAGCHTFRVKVHGLTNQHSAHDVDLTPFIARTLNPEPSVCLRASSEHHTPDRSRTRCCCATQPMRPR